MGDESTTEDTSGLLSNFPLTAVPLRYHIGLIGLVALALLPFGLSIIDILKMTYALYFVVFVVSWDYLSGYTGQVSFGHTLFFATAAYTTTLLNLEFGVSPALGIVVGTLAAGLAGLFIGLPALRVHGHYLAIVTLLPPLIMERLFVMFSDTFGGSKGLSDPQNLLQAGSFDGTVVLNYYLGLAVFLLIFGLAYLITRSDTGVVFTAIQEDEDAVSSAGINPAKFKVFAWVTSALFAGFAGAVFAHSPVGGATPSQVLELGIMIEILIASIFGGFGTLVGPALGGFFVWWARDYISNLGMTVPVVNTPVQQVDILIFYVLMLVLLFYLPRGLLPWALNSGRIVLDRTFGTDSATPAGGERKTRLERVRENINELMGRDK